MIIKIIQSDSPAHYTWRTLTNKTIKIMYDLWGDKLTTLMTNSTSSPKQ